MPAMHTHAHKSVASISRLHVAWTKLFYVCVIFARIADGTVIEGIEYRYELNEANEEKSEWVSKTMGAN